MFLWHGWVLVSLTHIEDDHGMHQYSKGSFLEKILHSAMLQDIKSCITQLWFITQLVTQIQDLGIVSGMQ